MSLVTALVVGGLIGLRHSVEADHVAAVATLIDDRRPDHPGLIGTSWGIGHAVPIVALGLLFVTMGVNLPAAVTSWFEALAGVVLVLLGARMLRGVLTVHRHERDGHSISGRLWRRSDRGRSHADPEGDGIGGEADLANHNVHAHDHGHGHVHVHEDDDPALHLHLGPVAIGASHGHRYDESLLVGTLHGLAGSGALVVGLVAAAPTVGASLAFLASFTLVTVLTMGSIAFLWGRLVSGTRGRLLRGVAGVSSVLIGFALVGSELAGVGLLAGIGFA